MSADFDREIDRAVREMLDVEPPAGLRARVMSRIEGRPVASAHVASAFRRKSVWIAVAAAAVIVIAIVLARRNPPAPSLAPTASPSIAQATPRPQTLPPPVTTVTPPAATSAARVARLPEAGRPRDTQRVIAAAVAESTPDEGFPQVPSLSVPALTVSAIRGVAPAATPTQIGVDPIATPAPIDIDPLPLSPRERQDQE